MIILHGIYDNGKIDIKEKDLPELKAEFEIEIPEKKDENQGTIVQLAGIWKNRKDIKDSVKWVSSLRKKSMRKF